MSANTPEPNASKPKYEPTAKEQSVLGKHISRRAARAAPRLKVLKKGKIKTVSVDHPDQSVGWSLLMEALGTADVDFVDGLIRQLLDAIPSEEANFLLSVIKDIQPKDHLESMLAAQMAVVHRLAMTFARRLPHVGTVQEQDSTERALNKLMRTFTTQMEALKRYRSGGEPQVTVQNVSVREGGQAIVGNVTQAPRETAPNKTDVSPPALTDGRAASMPMIDEKERVALPRGQKNDTST